MFNSILSDINRQKPLILNLTNFVTVNDVANCILAIGASPVMSDDLRDSVELVKSASAVNINIGTVNRCSLRTMIKAGKTANSCGKVIVLDPVGCGATKFRTDVCKKLISKIKFDVIKGNMSEIKALTEIFCRRKSVQKYAGISRDLDIVNEKSFSSDAGHTFGVDVNSSDAITENNLSQNIELVKKLAKKLNCIIAATGKYDLVSDGDRCFVISNGNELMEKVCGTGCMISGMLGAFAACSREKKLEAVAACISAMGIAGESAVRKSNGGAVNSTKIIDELFCMTDDILKREAKYEMQNSQLSKKLCLYAVTDRHWLKNESLASVVEKAIKGGTTFVQLREKNCSDEEFLQLAREVKVVCKKYNVPFVINDNVEIAKIVGADGVHVGQSDMNAANVRKIIGDDAILGVSVQTVEQALIAEKQGADYLGVGAVFKTNSKDDADFVTHETLKAICDAVKIPVVAIGGINQSNVSELDGSGICGVSVISAIFGEEDIERAARELKEKCVSLFQKEFDETENEFQIKKTFNRGMKVSMTIAGSDSSGGAGIQADIKTMTCNGVYAMSAITALTAQNTTGVYSIMNVTPEFLEDQIDANITDICPDSVKIGMVSDANLIKVISNRLKFYKVKNIVVDPVMVATSGAKLIADDAIDVLKMELLNLATLVTPNIPEAELLSETKINTADDMINAAKIISEKYHCAVLCKGGHNLNDANDLLYQNGKYKWFKGNRIDNPNTHGTGCTLSSAIASNLAKGFSLEKSVELAKEYISGALSAMLDLGKGSGPMNHAWKIV